MNLHEYQAKELIKKYGVPVLRGYLAYTAREAEHAAVNLGGGVCVVKAQIHAGGRGKGGGVKVAKNPLDAATHAEKIIGMTLVSPQTGPEGRLVRKVWIEEGAEIAKEYYVSLLVNRDEGCVAFVVSAEGGMEIEEVAHAHPEKVLTINVRPESGLQEFHCRQIANFLKLDKDRMNKLTPVLKSLYRAFVGLDSSMLEINPLIETKAGEFICLDAKMSIDDNALFRQKDAQKMMDYDEIDERELRASQLGINYVALDGNIGCMVNGAGLAMATMDIIKQAGGMPANFLDVGGGATKEMVRESFKLILKDPSVKGILINIFGGIMRCDVIAEGVVEAARELAVKVPVVVRLEGTNVEKGKEILAQSGLKILAADDMGDAAKKIVQSVQGK